jgi:hypothetical protein
MAVAVVLRMAMHERRRRISSLMRRWWRGRR